MSAVKKLWREAYRLARMTPCSDGNNISWIRAYPDRMIEVLGAAWCRHGDRLSDPLFIRVILYRAGVSRNYVLHGNPFFNPRLPK